MIQRLIDCLREYRIKRIDAELARALVDGEKGETVALWCQLRNEIKQRSPAQIARMERKRGIA